MHLILTDPVHQSEGANDALKPHGQLYDLFTLELAWQASTSAPYTGFAMEAQITYCDGFDGR